MRRAFANALCAWACLGLAALPAAAEDEPFDGALIVLVGMGQCCAQDAWPEAENALSAELSTLNITVATVNGVATSEREQRLELERVVAERKAVCAVRIERIAPGEGGGVELWISDRLTGKTTIRRVPVEDSNDREFAEIVALRLVEALRAGLLEIEIGALGETSAKGKTVVSSPIVVAPRPQSATSPKPAQDEKKCAPAPEQERGEPHLGVGLGAEAAGSPGGIGAMGALDLVVGWHPIGRLSVALDLFSTVIATDLKKDGGRASVGFGALRGWISWNIRDKGVLRPSLGLGGGAALSWASGETSDAYAGATDYATVGYMGALLQLGLAFKNDVWLILGARAGALVPEVRVSFAGSDVASMGRPLVEGFLIVDVRFL
ncbi:MAG: hypothetical protein PHU25_21730 [Deltaproteobacteria bacterium]|nr:hypothetical protein [Deltaproteobacteria bacterium]